MAERSRILVVDDETQITRVLKTTLQSQGYEVKTAAEAESALNLAVDWIPDRSSLTYPCPECRV